MLEIQRLSASAVEAVQRGRNLTVTLTAIWARHPQLTAQQRGAIIDVAHGTLRFKGQLEAVLQQLLAKPLADDRLRWLLLVALYQLTYSRAARYAVVDHAVRCTAALDLPRAGGLVNAVLRNFLRREASLLARAAHSDEGRYSYPQWWIDKLRAQYADGAGQVLEAGNQQPPFTLRINRGRTGIQDYLEQLAREGIVARAAGSYGVTLAHGLRVERLPGFADGLVSVQDAGAQVAAPLLDVEAGMRVLDACAAPGGKTGHLLELADINLIALDKDASRLHRVHENLQRLKLEAQLVAADANDVQAWWNGKPFDRILADSPCSASGVVRRHPDIKWLRRPGDVAQFAAQQSALLDTLWRLLSSGGKLLYTTCSVFGEENSLQVAAFQARHADAVLLPLCGLKTLHAGPQGQLLPNDEHDGFFYALLQKN